MVPGERVRSNQDYDLFGNNILDQEGIYIKTFEKRQKCLVYYPQHTEWAELPLECLIRVAPGEVSVEDGSFLARIQVMKCSYGAE